MAHTIHLLEAEILDSSTIVIDLAKTTDLDLSDKEYLRKELPALTFGKKAQISYYAEVDGPVDEERDAYIHIRIGSGILMRLACDADDAILSADPSSVRVAIYENQEEAQADALLPDWFIGYGGVESVSAMPAPDYLEDGHVALRDMVEARYAADPTDGVPDAPVSVTGTVSGTVSGTVTGTVPALTEEQMTGRYQEAREAVEEAGKRAAEAETPVVTAAQEPLKDLLAETPEAGKTVIPAADKAVEAKPEVETPVGEAVVEEAAPEDAGELAKKRRVDAARSAATWQAGIAELERLGTPGVVRSSRGMGFGPYATEDDVPEEVKILVERFHGKKTDDVPGTQRAAAQEAAADAEEEVEGEVDADDDEE